MTDSAKAERRDPSGRGAPLITGKTPLPEAFFERSAIEVARDLLGRLLLSTVNGTRVLARIVEAEAYFGPDDEASHASARIGRTKRNEAMFGRAGTAYVYRIYGIHWCLNAVTDAVGHPAAVLIRAAEVLEGDEAACQRRGARPVTDLLRGPGNLCTGLGVTGELNLHRLSQPPLQVLSGSPVPAGEIQAGPRVGITRAVDLPLRFWIKGNTSVSNIRAGTPRSNRT